MKRFLNVSYEVETHAVPNKWQKWISIVRKKHGKTQTSQIYGFLKYFRWTRNSYNSQNMGKVNLLSTGKVWENTETSHILHYSPDLELMRTNAIPNVWECINFHKIEIFHTIPRLCVFEEIRSYYETQIIHRVWEM